MSKKKRKIEKAAADVAYICARCNGNGAIMRDTIEILGKRLEAEVMQANAVADADRELQRIQREQISSLRKRIERLEQELTAAVNRRTRKGK